jgi:hypothetical protein
MLLVGGQIEVLSWGFPGGNEKNQEKFQDCG